MFVEDSKNNLCVNIARVHKLKYPLGGGFAALARGDPGCNPGVGSLLLSPASTSPTSTAFKAHSVSSQRFQAVLLLAPLAIAKKKKKKSGWPANFLISQQPLTTRETALASKSRWKTRQRSRDQMRRRANAHLTLKPR